MPKRKKEESEDERKRRKIEKLERRLARYRDVPVSLSSQDEENAHLQELDPELLTIGQQDQSDRQDLLDQQDLPDQQELPEETTEELDSSFLMALGESCSGEKQYGENIHIEIFNTVKNILLEGLQKNNKDKLMETLLIPGNCKLLDAPRLNMELLAVLNNPAKTRDKLLQERQQELGSATAGVCQVINSLSKKDFDKLNIIKKLSDISRVMGNIHFQYTEIRRKLVNPFLDKSLVESLKDNKREEFLYSNLDNSVKSYSAMKRASNTLKPKPATAATKFAPKNFQQPPRRPSPFQVQANQAHPGRGSFRGQRFNHRQPFRQMGPSPRGRAKYP